MKPIKTQQKFQCDFCKKRSVKSVIAKHEQRCFRNPNRFCDNCENKGYVIVRFVEDFNDVISGVRKLFTEPCKYCEKFNPTQLAEIEAYENG